tara:strand:- start:2057 stop:2314 length:258 start_codon:yes stop_codon:yes gene_type:complete
MTKRDGKFMRMINYGKVYRPTSAVIDEAIKSGDSYRQVAEELAFAIATVCDAGDISLEVAKDVIDTIAKVQHAAHMYCGEVVGDA